MEVTHRTFGLNRQKWSDKFCGIRCFLISFMDYSMVSQCILTYIVTQITSIERQFCLSSTQTGLLISCNDIGFLSLILIVSYFGHRTHVPKALSVSAILILLSSILFVVPHLIFKNESAFSNYENSSLTPWDATVVPFGNISRENQTQGFLENDNDIYITNKEENGNSKQTSDIFKKMVIKAQICSPKKTIKPKCGIGDKIDLGERNVKIKAYAVFILAMIIQGMAKSPRFSLGLQYIDDKKNTPLYIGLTMASYIVGILFSYILGTIMNSLPVTLEESDVDRRSPDWIEAWWLGFIVIGIMSAISAISLFCFPRTLRNLQSPDDNDNRDEKALNEQDFNHDQLCEQKFTEEEKVSMIFGEKRIDNPREENGLGPSKPRKRWTEYIKGVILAVQRLFGNKVYVGVTLTSILQIFYTIGDVSFAPKYLEAEFGIPAWRANILTGGVKVGSGLLGSVLVGVYLKKRKVTPLQTVRLYIGCLVVWTLTMVISATATGCPNKTVLGLHKPEAKGDNNCTANCSCDDESYFPVCGADGNLSCRLYQRHLSGKKGLIKRCHNFVNCSCTGSTGGRVKAGSCPTDCQMLVPFMVLQALAAICLSTGAIMSWS